MDPTRLPKESLINQNIQNNQQTQPPSRQQDSTINSLGNKVFAETSETLTSLLQGEKTLKKPITSLTDEQLFEKELQDWVNRGGDDTNLANRKIAADRIQNAYIKKLDQLILSKLSLTTLPHHIGELKQLTWLHLENNLLNTLPVEIKNLTQLQNLFLQHNQLKDLQPEIGCLTSLKLLNLRGNLLEDLPSDIGNLGNLLHLFLDENKLQTIPNSIGNLGKLETLNLHLNNLKALPPDLGGLKNLMSLSLLSNPDLNDLPMSLCKISSLTKITSDNPILTPLIDQIFSTIQVLKAAEKANELVSELTSWVTAAEIDNVLTSRINELSLKQIDVLFQWLKRLKYSDDFIKRKQSLAKIVCNMLSTVFDNKEFQEAFFAQASVNIEGCPTRSSGALNEIYSSWKVLSLPSNAPIVQKLEILTSVAKAVALRKIVASYITKEMMTNKDRYSENVNQYLYYESVLKDRLNLQSAIEENVPGIDHIGLDKLEKQVQDTYFDSLIDIPMFMQLFKMETPNTQIELTKLSEAFKSEIGDCPHPNELDPTALEWRINANKLLLQVQNHEKNEARKWYESVIGTNKS